MNRRAFFLTALSALLPKPSQPLPVPLPKYQIGDRIRFKWHEQETGWQGWEVGIIQGLTYSESSYQGFADWSYEIYVIDSSYPPSIGLTDEVYESEVESVPLPIWLKTNLK